jgi:PA14 domain/Chitobiase/beta-hexosaminidase C-terminal domain
VIEDARACPLLSRVELYAAPPRVSVAADERVFLGSTLVTMSADRPDAEVRYTLDGSVPTRESALYTEQIAIDTSVVVRARAFAPGADGSPSAPLPLRAYTAATLREPIHLFKRPEPGWRVAYHEGDWKSVAELAGSEPRTTGVVPAVDLSFRERDERFGLVFQGFVDVPEDGIWAFFLASDDGSRLWLGDELVVDDDGLHGRVEVMGEIGLKRGWHPVRVEYFDAGGGSALELAWRGPKVGKGPLPAERVGH